MVVSETGVKELGCAIRVESGSIYLSWAGLS